MLKHIAVLFFRNASRYKSTLLVNLIGLTSALTCTILIYLWVSDEYSVDKFHANHGRLFQLLERDASGDEVIIKTGTPEFAVRALMEEMPEIETADVSTPPDFFPKFTLSDLSKHVQGAGKFAGKDFFSVFSYGLTEGDVRTVLRSKNAIVLSEKMALSLFGKADNAIGKAIQWNMQNLVRDAVVTGIFTNLPSAASEHFDFVLSMDAFNEIMAFGDGINWANGGPFISCLVLKKNADQQQFKDKLAGLLAKKKQQNRSLFIRPFADGYLYDHYENGVQAGGRITQLRLFTLLGLIILLVASINFMNLITARASVRMKEIGIKKSIGAPRSTLMVQYFSEAMITALIALSLALIVAVLVLPAFNSLSGKQLALHFNGEVVAAILGITLLTGFAAGSYPAFYLSGFKPLAVLKGLIVTSPSERLIRKGLVMFQFTVTTVLIISVLVVYRQMSYVNSKSLGYDRENVLYFESSGAVASDPEGFLARLKRLPGVVNASSMVGSIIGGSGTVDNGGGDGIVWNGKRIRLQSSVVNYNLPETLGMKFIEGRGFSRELDVDTVKIILNRAAINALGLTDPIGKRIPQYNNALIVGIVEDFNYQSLHLPVKPFVFQLSPHYAMTLLARIRPGREQETIESIKKTYAEFNPGYEFEFGFLDQAYTAQYASERRVEVMAEYLTALAIIISCLGLLGLAQFSAARKTREICIRKILGSGQWGIVYLLSRDFVKVILSALCIALPLGYYTTSHWLDGFAYRIILDWWYFAVAGTTVIVIAAIAIATQVLGAARANVVEGLK